MPDPEKTVVLGYIRVSSDAQAERGMSLETQRAKLTAYAVAADLDIVEIFEDGGFSAKSLKRPGMIAVLEALEEGRAQALLVVKLDRLTRNVKDLGWLIEAERFGEKWDLLAVADSIDTRSASGRLVLNVLASVSQWEREAVGERTREVLRHLKKQGVRLGAAPFGTAFSEHTDDNGRRQLDVVPEEAETARRMIQLRQDGRTLRKICEILEKEGHVTKRGGRWQPSTVGRILKRLNVHPQTST